ncbi:MAG: (4Fe-4S)-binding protein, partial [Firmicutes bacterium]|nr:(4Fe-4S)-binding protein [Bacillota bacterium]
MEYRINRRTGDRISEIGMGTSVLFQAGRLVGAHILEKAYEGGINYFDLAGGHGDNFPIFGDALSDVRKNIHYQLHFGADYSKGEYGWSLELDNVKRSVDKELT